jgi:hypothetical protein
MAKWTVLLVAAVWLALPGAAAAQPISDYSAALVTPGGRCLIPDKVKGDLRAYSCTNQGARYSIKDGVIRNAAGQCWDHGIPESNTSFSGRTAVHMMPCHGGKSQTWYFFSSHRTKNGIIQSAANRHACITIQNESEGAPAVVAKCDSYEAPSARQTIYVGERLTDQARSSAQRHIGADVWRRFNARGVAALADGTQMVAAGGGNIIIAPGPAIVAAGAGNMIQPGGGNILPSGAGNITAGGARLIGNDGGSLMRLAGVGLRY